MEKILRPVLTIRLFSEEKCFGPGIAELLERVEEHRSLRAAAASMDMAYSKAWTIVRRCEENLGMKLLDYTTGGKNGGGACVTADGKILLSRYRNYCARLRQEADRLFREEFSQ